ncbi:hypothetical protein ACWGID_09560 [Kribbella sp. NPDC054772]
MTRSEWSDSRFRAESCRAIRWLPRSRSALRSRNHQYPAVNGQASSPTRTFGLYRQSPQKSDAVSFWPKLIPVEWLTAPSHPINFSWK